MNTKDLLFIIKKDLNKHLIIWALVTTFLCITDPVEGTLFVQVIGTFLIMFSYIFVYYTSLLILYQYFNVNSKLFFIFLLALIYAMYIAIDYINFKYIFKEFPIINFSNIQWFYDWLLIITILFIIVTTVAHGTYQNTLSKLKIKESYENEKIMLNKELGFYKNQFNPHITFNFLNYCYSFVNQKSQETADVIETYSEMLRYTIHCKPDETVPLTDEVEYLSKFIFLKKQLTKGIFVDFDIKGDLLQKHILPRILITFVENAFKHGDTHCEENPIHISLETANNEIIFKVSNKKNTSKNKPISTGIGQLNVKSQLELFYKDKYELVINENSSEFYATTLKINLN